MMDDYALYLTHPTTCSDPEAAAAKLDADVERAINAFGPGSDDAQRMREIRDLIHDFDGILIRALDQRWRTVENLGAMLSKLSVLLEQADRSRPGAADARLH